MSKEDVIEVDGIVVEILPGSKYKVQLTNGHIVLAYVCGKMRKNSIKITAGDSVKLELSPYDLTKGRISFRNK